MAERSPFLLRLDPEVLAALRKWAEDDLRSLNGQIEFVLRRALVDARRLRAPGGSAADGPSARRSRARAGPGGDDAAVAE